MIHGGIRTADNVAAFANLSFHRTLINMSDCESSLKQNVEWLKREFPDARFMVKKTELWTET